MIKLLVTFNNGMKKEYLIEGKINFLDHRIYFINLVTEKDKTPPRKEEIILPLLSIQEIIHYL